jgi:flagellar motor switch protein FliM
MNVRPFDFRDIAALDDTAVSIRNWFSKATSFFSDYWVEATGFSAKVGLGSIATESYETILEQIPREDLCCVAEISERASSIWYTSADQMRIVVSDLLCISDPEESNEKELSAIEVDLSSYFVDRLAESISQGWMGAGELPITLSPLEKDPRKLRLFRGKDLVTKIGIEIECRSGKATLDWLLPKHKMASLLDNAIELRSEGEPVTPPKELIGQLPLQVVTLLGSVNVPMTELANLKPGELIILDQRIDSPMVSQVDGTPAFECWPGRLGKKQAVQVATTLNT